MSVDGSAVLVMSHIFLESHGVKLDVEVEDDALLPVVEAILPPGWRRSEEFPEDGHITLAGGPGGVYDVFVDNVLTAADVTSEVAIHVVDAEVRAIVALLAHERIFIHAGVVAVRDHVLVLPAPSFAGKSSLVSALVAAGAAYFSDEFAVLDADGLVHAYPRPISIRSESRRYGEKVPVESLGGRAGAGPLRIGLIAATRYVPGERWDPRRPSSGSGAMALLTNAVPARSRPEETMRTVNRAAAGAVVLEGPRGEAAQTADLLMRELERIAVP